MPFQFAARTLACLSLAASAALVIAPSAWAADVEVQLGAGDAFVVRDNTGAIERLHVDEATGNVSRNGSLFVHTTGTNSLFVGNGAGTASYGSTSSTAFGDSALSNKNGSFNAAFGGLRVG